MHGDSGSCSDMGVVRDCSRTCGETDCDVDTCGTVIQVKWFSLSFAMQKLNFSHIENSHSTLCI